MISPGCFSLETRGFLRFSCAVKSPFVRFVCTIALISSFAALPSAQAQLSSLSEPPWTGYYAAYESKRFHIGLSAQGDIKLTPIGSRGAPVSHQLTIPIDIGIEEIMPDGKVVMRQVKVETLSATDPATDKLEKATFRGKVTGDAVFEATIEQSRGIIFIGGRVVEPGTLTKNPIRCAVRAKFPDAYKNAKKGNPLDESRENKKIVKAFEKKIAGDLIELKWTDGKRVKQDFEKPVEAASKDLNGPGIASAEIEISAYQGKRFVFTAAPNSSMTLWNPQSAPLHEGFSIHWSSDAAKDTEGKARLAIEVK